MLFQPLDISSFSGLLYRISKTQRNAYMVSDKQLSLITEAVALSPGVELHIFVLGDMRVYARDPFIYLDNEIITSGLMLQQQEQHGIMRGSHFILSLTEIASDVHPSAGDCDEMLSINEFTISMVVSTGTTSDSEEASRAVTGSVGTYATLPLFKKLLACHSQNKQLSIELLGHMIVYVPEPQSSKSAAIYKALRLLSSRSYDLDCLLPLKNYTTEDAVELAGILSDIIDNNVSYAWYMALFSIMHCFLMSPMPSTKSLFELAFAQHKIDGLIKYHEKQIQLAVTFLSSLYSSVLLNFFANLVLNLSIDGYPYQTGVMAQLYRACSYLYFNKMVSEDILIQLSNLGRYLIMDAGLVTKEAVSRLDLHLLQREICFSNPTEADLVYIYLQCYQLAYENEHCNPAEFFDEIIFHNITIRDLPTAISYPIAAFPKKRQFCVRFLTILAEELALSYTEGTEMLINAIMSLELQDLRFLSHLSIFADACADIIRTDMIGRANKTITDRFAYIYQSCARLIAGGLPRRSSLLLLLLSHAGSDVYKEPLRGSAQEWLQETCPNLVPEYSPLLAYILFCSGGQPWDSRYILNSEKHALAIYSYRILQSEEHSTQDKHMAALICLQYMMRYSLILTDPPVFLKRLSFYPIFREAANEEMADKYTTHLTYRPHESDYTNKEYYSDLNVAFNTWCTESNAVAREKGAVTRAIKERCAWPYSRFDSLMLSASALDMHDISSSQTDTPHAAIQKTEDLNCKSESASDSCADEEVCAICLRLLQSNAVIELGCRHYFCANCVARSVLRSGRCALCRREVTQLKHGDVQIGLPGAPQRSTVNSIYSTREIV